MKKIFVFIVLSFSSILLFSQQDSTKKEEPFTLAEQMPSFPGGLGDWMIAKIKYIGYPKAEEEAGISGKCYVTFTIDKDGNVTDPKILKGVPGGPGYDKLALDVVNAMPRWAPGTQNGKAVSVQYNLPISFTVKGKETGKVVRKINKANAHYTKGADFFINGKYDKAIKEFDKALKIRPNHINALYNRGLVFLNLKKIDEACKDWNKIKTLSKPDADELIDKYCK